MMHASTNIHATLATGPWDLFVQSMDIFTVILLLGSVAGVTLIFWCIAEIREKAIAPKSLAGKLEDMSRTGNWDGLRATVRDDASLLGAIVRAGVSRLGRDRASIRDAAELAAAEGSATWFRRIDLLNLIGNLGPLVGLAGTVWGMILAFTSLGDGGGQAGPADLSLGISKALFHTLLGLCLAVPCLLAYAGLKSRADRLCTRAIVIADEIIERIPSEESAKAEAK